MTSAKDLATLQTSLNAYTTVKRRHYLPGTDIHEDDSSHSLSVQAICWHYYELLKPDLSEAKIYKYAMIHDLVEIYAGDVIAYASESALKQKVYDEAQALDRLTEELAFNDDIVDHLKGYQNHVDDEATFVWACDKIQAYIQSRLDNWRAHLEYPVTKQMFIDKLAEQSHRVPEVLKEEFDRLSEEWISAYPDV